MTDPGLDILAEGLVCPVPGSLHQIAAAVLEGDPHFERHEFFVGADGLPLTGGWVEGCRNETETGRRMGHMLRAALAQALGPGPADRLRMLGPDVPVILGLPSWVAHEGPVQDGLWHEIRAVIADLGRPRWKIVPADQIAAFGALEEAARTIGAAETQAAIVVGLDSLCAPVICDHRAMTGQARIAGAPHAAIPAEAAAVLVVGSGGRLPFPVLSRVEALEIAQEAERLEDPDRGILGRALGQCLRKVIPAGASRPPPDRVFADLNGERWRAEDWGGAVLQLDQPPDGVSDPVCPAEAMGDTGAAHGAASVILARQALSVPGSSALVCAATRQGGRAALRMTRIG